jgi:hypothetical protein
MSGYPMVRTYVSVKNEIEIENSKDKIVNGEAKDRELNNLQNCLVAMRFALPHPLTPSPRAGEGGQEILAPLSRSGRGAGGEGQKLRLFNPWP